MKIVELEIQLGLIAKSHEVVPRLIMSLNVILYVIQYAERESISTVKVC